MKRRKVEKEGKEEKRKTDVRMDGQIPPVFYRTSSPLGLLPKKEKERERERERERETERERQRERERAEGLGAGLGLLEYD